MKICLGGWYNQLERMNTRADNDNGRATGMVKGSMWKIWQFLIK